MQIIFKKNSLADKSNANANTLVQTYKTNLNFRLLSQASTSLSYDNDKMSMVWISENNATFIVIYHNLVLYRLIDFIYYGMLTNKLKYFVRTKPFKVTVGKYLLNAQILTVFSLKCSLY